LFFSGVRELIMEEEQGVFNRKIPLIRGETKRIEIDEEDTEELREKGLKCLVGRFGTPKKINKEAFKSVLTRIWRTTRGVFFKEILDNLWIFEFEKDTDRRRVLDGRPWTYDRTLLILNEVDGSVPPSQMSFNQTPIWIQIHDMPLACMNKRVGCKIGSSLGEVEEVAVAEDDVGWGRYLRVRVKVELFQPLERGRSLIQRGQTCWVKFKYEKLPIFCFQCGRILHEPKGCPAHVQKQKNHQSDSTDWGAWLRADDLYKGSKLSEDHRSGRPSTNSEEEVRETAREGTINADSNPKGRRANSAPPSPNVSDANSKSHYSFHSRQNQGRKETVMMYDRYGNKERERKGGKRNNMEDFGEKDMLRPQSSCLKGGKTKALFSFKAQGDKSQASMAYKPKKEGKSARGSRGKKSTSPCGNLSTYPSEYNGPRQDPNSLQQRHGKASESKPMVDQGSKQGKQEETNLGIRTERGNDTGVGKEKEAFLLPLKRAPEEFAEGNAEFQRYKEMRFDNDFPSSVSTWSVNQTTTFHLSIV
jgi:hypothetical protein